MGSYVTTTSGCIHSTCYCSSLAQTCLSSWFYCISPWCQHYLSHPSETTSFFSLPSAWHITIPSISQYIFNYVNFNSQISPFLHPYYYHPDPSHNHLLSGWLISLLNGLFASVLAHFLKVYSQYHSQKDLYIAGNCCSELSSFSMSWRIKSKLFLLASTPYLILLLLTSLTSCLAFLPILHYVLVTLTPWLFLKHRWALYFKVSAHSGLLGWNLGNSSYLCLSSCISSPRKSS